MSLIGKVALVTGSTSGIGLATARYLAHQGCNVMLNGLGDLHQIEAIRQEIETETGRTILYHGADMTSGAQIKDLIETTVEALGSIDILVNNAGVQYVNPVEEFDPEMWDKIIAVNLSSSFYTMHYAVPYMKKQNWGRIINIASVHGLVASVNKAGYVAAKHGLVGLTKVVALETAQTGVTANTICPGWVWTDLIKKQVEIISERDSISFDEAKKRLVQEKQPSHDFVLPEEISSLVAYLCSDAARQITGANHTIDGGWTAQ